jgi:hypothetical protein
MHVLAYVYHWGRDELWHIPRGERLKWIEQVRRQKEKENPDSGGESYNPSNYRESD